MAWYEYLIIIVALFLVILPIILHFHNKKHGKTSCGCGCENCSGNCPLKNKH